MTTDDHEWQRIWDGVAFLNEWFPDGAVLIGGIAVWLHATHALPNEQVDRSHDVDLYLSLLDYSTLRDLEEVTHNRRLKKHQLIRDGIDFDIYVESQHGLIVPYDQMLARSTVISGFRCACLEHLLALKARAYHDRATSSKGSKDARDVLRLLQLLAQPDALMAASPMLPFYFDNAAMASLTAIVADPTYPLEMTHGNAHAAATLRAAARSGLGRLQAAVDDQPPDTLPPSATAKRVPGVGG